MPGPVDIDLIAASLRADTGDLRIYVEVLADKLTRAFPGQCVVRRSGLLRNGPVRTIVVAVGESRFELDHNGGDVTARRSSVVRGIAVKSEELALDRWIDALASAVLDGAAESERGRLALENLLIGPTSEEAT